MKKITITLNIPDGSDESQIVVPFNCNRDDLTTEEIIDLIPLLNGGIGKFLATMRLTHGPAYITKIIERCVKLLID